MKTLLLIRHAQSHANAGGAPMPDRELPLSDTGRRQAAELPDRLPEGRRVFVSRMRRTGETAAPYCARHGIGPAVLPCLDEFSYLPFGLIARLRPAERRVLAQDYWQRGDVRERAGQETDSFADFDARVEAFLQRWHEWPDGSLMFGHGIWIALLAWKLLGFQAVSSADMAAFRAFQTALPMPNAAVWTLSGRRREDLRLTFRSAPEAA
ncbi:histidine phosphatase family protein [Eikenella sp. S3360]|uniref:Histidine phosphatase family protein n=1 Tax=Eikenella glucosivorans TaxID=2766967 RepID=A0ABS0NC44_9NEIS|nr:histidine phosphatase family protein [Eikenella glucosivorans]MBH5329878.1 histidine phosphatase family protein [Eikenella glucosivorans]